MKVHGRDVYLVETDNIQVFHIYFNDHIKGFMVFVFRVQSPQLTCLHVDVADMLPSQE